MLAGIGLEPMTFRSHARVVASLHFLAPGRLLGNGGFTAPGIFPVYSEVAAPMKLLRAWVKQTVQDEEWI